MHSARHTTSTLLNKARVSQETRMKVVGHSTAAAHQGYVHVDHETARAACRTSMSCWIEFSLLILGGPCRYRGYPIFFRCQRR